MGRAAGKTQINSFLAGPALKRWGWVGFFFGASLVPVGFMGMLYVPGTGGEGVDEPKE